ncbi:zinc-dependent alcohol dehydrogenase [Microbacterium lacusdiani]
MSNSNISGPTSSTMTRAIAEPQAGVRLESAAIPTPAEGEVLVRSSLVGICGSDTHAIAGHHPFLTSTYLPGHEAVGVVAAVGPGVQTLHDGQRVILKPNVNCGVCLNCESGRTNACEKLEWIGCDPTLQRAGAMAQYFVAPAGNLFLVPDAVDDATAALVECLATPVHAARIAGDLRGARVVVLGAGTIGLLCVVAALHAGASSVVVTDMDPGKIERAKRVGAHDGFLASEPGVNDRIISALGEVNADVVFDCVAVEGSFRQAIGLLRRAGTLLVVGVPPRDAALPMPLIQDWEIRVQGAAAYTEEDIITSLEIAESGGLPADEVVSAVYPLTDVAAAFAAAAADSSGKLLVAP